MGKWRGPVTQTHAVPAFLIDVEVKLRHVVFP